MVRVSHLCLLCWPWWCWCLGWWWACCRFSCWYGDVIVCVKLQFWTLRMGLQRCPRTWTHQNKPAESAIHGFSVPAGDRNRWAEFRISPRIIKTYILFCFTTHLICIYIYKHVKLLTHKSLCLCGLTSVSYRWSRGWVQHWSEPARQKGQMWQRDSVGR